MLKFCFFNKNFAKANFGSSTYDQLAQLSNRQKEFYDNLTLSRLTNILFECQTNLSNNNNQVIGTFDLA